LYTRLMLNTACIVGNTSSSIREGAFLGAPAVNVGTRQAGRERGANVIDVPHDHDAIIDAVDTQISHGKYDSDPVYGDGQAGERIADILATAEFQIQKRLDY
jgi:UDP-N-acetylglucosamine 2-epimerase